MPTPDFYESCSSPLQRWRWAILCVALLSWVLPFAAVLGSLSVDVPPPESLPLVLALSFSPVLPLWGLVLIPHFFHRTEGWLRRRDSEQTSAGLVLRARWLAAVCIDGLLLFGALIAVVAIALLAAQ